MIFWKSFHSGIELFLFHFHIVYLGSSLFNQFLTYSTTSLSMDIRVVSSLLLLKAMLL